MFILIVNSFGIALLYKTLYKHYKMKKSLLMAFALTAFASTINAQDEAAAAFKPKAGDVAVELGLAGGLLNTSTDISNSGNAFPKLIKVRYFLNDKMALRASFSFQSKSETEKVYDLDKNGKQTSESGFQKISNSFYGLNLGVEKHFKGTDRLSTYLGGDLSLGIFGASLKEENYNNGVYDDQFSNKIKGSNNNGSTGGFGFGLRAVTGAEYYFVKKAYLGVEAGWGFFLKKDSKVKTTTTVPDGTDDTETTTTETFSPGSSFDLKPQVIAGVRIGYIF